MENESAMPETLVAAHLRLISKITSLELQFKEMDSRMNELEGMIKSKIRIPCPVEGCLKWFRSNGHRNRHIRNSVEKGERDPRWKEHEEARKKLKLDLTPTSKEDPVSDIDMAGDDGVPLGPGINTASLDELIALQDHLHLQEVRSNSEPQVADHSRTTQRFMQPLVFYPVPLYSGLEPMNHDEDSSWELQGQISQRQNLASSINTVTPTNIPDLPFDDLDFLDMFMLGPEENGGDPVHHAGAFDTAGQ
ncbi:hypothetical protein F4803DRAFT_572632 [Xylaria telfairii]|nr:hypothetical protein F4803DRAFT_572632 [Xylaria telfairii]